MDSRVRVAHLPTGAARSSRVVVGVDGSAASVAALRYALEEGHRRGVTVEVVTAWLLTSSYVEVHGPRLMDIATGSARTVQDRVIDRVGSELSAVTPLVRTVVHGHAGVVLPEASRDAALLVVGHPDKYLPVQEPSDSVAAECLRRSAVPVVLVPPSPRGSR